MTDTLWSFLKKNNNNNNKKKIKKKKIIIIIKYKNIKIKIKKGIKIKKLSVYIWFITSFVYLHVGY